MTAFSQPLPAEPVHPDPDTIITNGDDRAWDYCYQSKINNRVASALERICTPGPEGFDPTPEEVQRVAEMTKVTPRAVETVVNVLSAISTCDDPVAAAEMKRALFYAHLLE